MTIVATTPARVPFVRIAPATFLDADRELQKVERFTAGLFQPRVITHALSPYSVQSTDVHLVCDATDGAITLTFPAAARVNGLAVVATKTDASANAVTLSGTFSGLSNPTLATRYAEASILAANGDYYLGPSVAALLQILGDLVVGGKITIGATQALSVDTNGIIDVGNGASAVKGYYNAPYAASASVNGTFLVDSATPGQFVFYANGTRYKVVGAAF